MRSEDSKSSRSRPATRSCAASPGGGGFGDPLERALDAVEKDLNLGYISPQTARDTYGAVVGSVMTQSGGSRSVIDVDASEAARKTRVA